MKVFLVDAICGVGFPSMLLAEECRKAGMTTPDGKWDRAKLLLLDETRLQELYMGLREARDEDELRAPPPPKNAEPPRIITCP